MWREWTFSKSWRLFLSKRWWWKNGWSYFQDLKEWICGLTRGNPCGKVWSEWWKTSWLTRRSLHGAKYEQVPTGLGENVHVRCNGWKGSWRNCVRWWRVHGSRRNCVRWWRVSLCVSMCGSSKGGYTTSVGTDCRKGSTCPWQPRPQEGYVPVQTAESSMGVTDTHQWTGPTHKRARCGRFRWWWHWFWRQHCTSRPTLIEWVVGFS